MMTATTTTSVMSTLRRFVRMRKLTAMVTIARKINSPRRGAGICVSAFATRFSRSARKRLS
jgi:hypothetical protein